MSWIYMLVADLAIPSEPRGPAIGHQVTKQNVLEADQLNALLLARLDKGIKEAPGASIAFDEFLRMPLHAHGERMIRCFDRFDNLVG